MPKTEINIKNEFADLLSYFEEFSNPDPECRGLERLLSKNGVPEVLKRFSQKPLNLNKVQLNQLFLISGLPSITFGFFKYYWLTLPNDTHAYDILALEKEDERDYDPTLLLESETVTEHHEGAQDSLIKSLEQFKWGLRRIYVDGLLYFGNVTLGFSELSKLPEDEIKAFFKKRCFDAKMMRERGPAMEFNNIPESDRCLISEMACKNHESTADGKSIFRNRLLDRHFEAKDAGVDEVKVGVLLSNKKISKRNALLDVGKTMKADSTFLSADLAIAGYDILEETVSSIEDIDRVLAPLVAKWRSARELALMNTRLYLSLVNDMDVYVATSMRTNEDFNKMAKHCKDIFKGFSKMTGLELRYFDPTMSAAEGHEDKGIIECLMVRCAKVLIYTSGDKDSYGKDAEAAMALSSGKPVIFFCDTLSRSEIFRKVHPLTKLVDFRTGVVNGAIIAETVEEVIKVLRKLFENSMPFKLERELENAGDIEKAYFRLTDRITESTVRIQTSDLFLSTAFWNYYHNHVKGR